MGHKTHDNLPKVDQEANIMHINCTKGTENPPHTFVICMRK